MSEEDSKNKSAEQQAQLQDGVNEDVDVSHDNLDDLELEIEIEAQDVSASGDNFEMLADKYADDSFGVETGEEVDFFEDTDVAGVTVASEEAAHDAPQKAKKFIINPNIKRNVFVTAVTIGILSAGAYFLKPVDIITSFFQAEDSQVQTTILSYEETEAPVDNVLDDQDLSVTTTTENDDFAPVPDVPEVTDIFTGIEQPKIVTEEITPPSSQGLEDLFPDKPFAEEIVEIEDNFPEVEDIEITDILAIEGAPNAFGETENVAVAVDADVEVDVVDAEVVDAVDALLEDTQAVIPEIQEIETPEIEAGVNIDAFGIEAPSNADVDVGVEGETEVDAEGTSEISIVDTPIELPEIEEIIELTEPVATPPQIQKDEEVKPITFVATPPVVAPIPILKPSLLANEIDPALIPRQVEGAKIPVTTNEGTKAIETTPVETLKTAPIPDLETQILSKRVEKAVSPKDEGVSIGLGATVKKAEQAEETKIEDAVPEDVIYEGNEAAFFERKEREQMVIPDLLSGDINDLDIDTPINEIVVPKNVVPLDKATPSLSELSILAVPETITSRTGNVSDDGIDITAPVVAAVSAPAIVPSSPKTARSISRRVESDVQDTSRRISSNEQVDVTSLDNARIVPAISDITKTDVRAEKPLAQNAPTSILQPQKRIVEQAPQIVPSPVTQSVRPVDAGLLEQAKTYRNQGLIESARQVYYLLLDDDPQNVVVLTQLTGMIAAQSPNKALVELSDIRRNYGESSTLYIQEGILLAQNNRQAEAVSSLKNAISFDSQNPISYYNLALIHDKAGQFGEAVANYKLSLAQVSGNNVNKDILPVDQINSRISILLSR